MFSPYVTLRPPIDIWLVSDTICVVMGRSKEVSWSYPRASRIVREDAGLLPTESLFISIASDSMFQVSEKKINVNIYINLSF
jgi:hypothetical protein